MDDAQGLRALLEQDGRVWLRGAADEATLHAMETAAGSGARPGERLASSHALASIVRSAGWARHIAHIWPGAHPVRFVSFDKSPKANWGVAWHQDRVVSVRRRAEVAGFSNWSKKAGVWHCEAPTGFLDRMLFVRVHLDDGCDENGAMEIALGSHRRGRVAADEAAAVAREHETELCRSKRGDVLVLKMLTLHQSRPSASASRRRVLRVDFACEPLPAPLEWADE